MSARSFLFAPGNRPERFVKALQSGADAVILDLEDGVPTDVKTQARAAVASWLSAEHPVYVRVNGLGTEWHAEDVRAIARGAGLRGIVLPKVQDPRQVTELAMHLTGAPSLLPFIESAQGLWNAREIARCPRVERLAFGHHDFQRDLGIDGENEEILFARSHLVFMSRLAGVGAPIDGITAALDDEIRLRADVDRARRLGFAGTMRTSSRARQRLPGLRAGHVVDLLLDHGAVHVVGAEAQRHLRQLRRHHDPVRLDVGDVVEHQPGGRDVAQVVVAGGVVLQPHVVVLGVVGERDEGVEAAGLVLQRAQAQQVVDLVLGPLDVAVEHGAVALDAHAVGDAVDLDPLAGVELAVADDLAHLGVEDLGAAARQRAQAGVAQAPQHLLDRQLLALGEPADLDGGEGLEVRVAGSAP